MKRGIVFAVGLAISFGISTICYGEQVIVAHKVDTAPAIDGIGTDSVWGEAQAITTHDEIADIDVILKAVYTDKEIFFLVSFPDPDESLTHKTWVWDEAVQMYKTGPDREDTFVFKWNMEENSVDLSIDSNNDYLADIWFMKMCRTNPVGYADDKYQHHSVTPLPKSYKLTSKTGTATYLMREGDSGTSAYKDTLYVDYKGDKMPRYDYLTPTGSRADIKAKGIWSDGRWTIEFRRALNTGNGDDVQFDTSVTYLFGVSRHEIAGRPPDPETDQPLYGNGDVSEVLTLRFETQ